MIDKTLDTRLARLCNGSTDPNDFIIADAKDGDMAFGVTAPGTTPSGALKTREHHLQAIRDMTASGLVDIMLLSASSLNILTDEGLFEDSAVTPAARLNDTTDIWMARGGEYRESPSRPFSSASLQAIAPMTSLGLYSMTFSNQIEADLVTLNAYRDFRESVRGTGVRHFLEVFNPAFDIGIDEDQIGHYINDMIIKAIAGVTRDDAPQFLKIQFNGFKSMSELCAYDPTRLITGILGGAKGTTRDTFELLHQASSAGARVALFGRKINQAEAPLELVRLMRQVITGALLPESAVEAYHEYLSEQGIEAQLTIELDREITDSTLMLA